jgi:hypothetical protein
VNDRAHGDHSGKQFAQSILPILSFAIAAFHVSSRIA